MTCGEVTLCDLRGLRRFLSLNLFSFVTSVVKQTHSQSWAGNVERRDVMRLPVVGFTQSHPRVHRDDTILEREQRIDVQLHDLRTSTAS